MLARAALWLLGADRYGDRYWQRLREDAADAPFLPPQPVATPNDPTGQQPMVSAGSASEAAATATAMRPRSWLGPRGGWLR